MKNVWKKVLLGAGLLMMALPMVAAKPNKQNKEAQEVRKIIDKVNTYWQTNNKPEVRSFWDNAAYHTGNMEAYFLTGNEAYRAYSEAWANHNQWKGAKSNNRAEWMYNYVKRISTCSSATGKSVSRHTSTSTISSRKTTRYAVHAR